MKLIRFGEPGREKPGVILGDGRRIDVSAFCADFDEAFFGDADGDGVGDFSVFTGPLADRDGAVRIEEGVSPDYATLDGFFAEPWFVAGVEGSLG